MTAIDDALHSAQVRELRAQGLAPKQIARALGLRPSDVIAVLNERPAAPAADQAEARCWVSGGWAGEVQVNGHDDWPGLDDVESPGGLVSVLVARRHRHDKVSVCGYLVDVHCLGVKDSLGPRVMDEVQLIAFRRQYFGAYFTDPVQAPLELARQLVLGAADYAHGLGFDPHPDYTDTVGHLGDPLGRCDIEFGRDGRPFYVEGPYDDADEITRTLDASVGPGNYTFVRTLPMSFIA